MKKEDLFKAFNNIDDDMLTEALEKKNKKNLSIWLKGLVATCAIALCVTVGYQSFGKNDEIITPGLNDGSSTPNEEKVDGNGINQPIYGTTGEMATNIVFIDRMENSKDEIFDIVSDGSVVYSRMLEKGLSTYKDLFEGKQVRYRIVIDLFDEEKLVKDTEIIDAEVARLAAAGYIVAYESITTETGTTNVLTLHASYDELKDFNSNNEYGYLLLFYGQRYPSDNSVSTTNGFIQ